MLKNRLFHIVSTDSDCGHLSNMFRRDFAGLLGRLMRHAIASFSSRRVQLVRSENQSEHSFVSRWHWCEFRLCAHRSQFELVSAVKNFWQRRETNSFLVCECRLFELFVHNDDIAKRGTAQKVEQIPNR
jgi:hypothetical protein